MIHSLKSFTACCLTALIVGTAHGQVLSTTPPTQTTLPPTPSATADQAEAKAPPSKVASRPAKPVLIRCENGAVNATLATPADVVEVGKAIQFTLTINAADGANLSIPDIGSTLGSFDIRDVRRTTSREGENRKSIISFIATTYESGMTELPAIEVHWTDAQSKGQTISVGPTPIEVVSLIGATFDPGIYRDIKGEVNIDVGGSWWWMAAAAAVVILGLLLWALRMHQRKVSEKVLAADEWAQRELDRLERDELIQRGDLHGFWVRLSGTVREYVEKRFDIAAPEQTTKEFLAQASSHPLIGAEHRHLLTDFLRAADMVKFAAHRPAEHDCSQGLNAARDFVRETSPIADAAPQKMEMKS